MKRHPITVHRNPLARLMPLPKPVRDRFILRAYTALESLTAGKEADVEAWRDLADVINVTETLAVHLRRLDLHATIYTQAANDSMKAAQARYKAGQALRLDGAGINAVRAILAIYEQCLTLMPERQVEAAFQATADEVRRLIASGVEAVSL